MKKRYFSIEEGKFNYIPSETVTDADIKKMLQNHKTYVSSYVSTALSFDIETTSYYSKKYDAELATMYIWQMGIDKNTIMGRTWGEMNRIIDLIAAALDEKEQIICWIQNFSFEWQFIKARFDWNKNADGYPDIFAKTDRNIIYARYKNIEFRDSMALTAMGLAKYQKNYNLPIGKLAGDLDYSLYRHRYTPLTKKELAYCINDVQVLNAWHKSYIVPTYLELEKKIPLTSTGIVRQEIKEEFAKLEKTEKKKMQTRIRNAQPTEQMYLLFRNYLFRGGLTHANTVRCNFLLEPKEGEDKLGEGMDLKSAHPSQALFELFPWKFNRRNVNQFAKVLQEAKEGEYAFFGIFKFKNIRCSGWHSLESKNKLIEYTQDATFDNGRLTHATEIKVALTEVDWFNYEDLYTWDSFECTCLYQAHKEPLPDYIRKVICHYFYLKETATDKFTRDLVKRKVNACFGMLATSLPSQSVIYDTYTNQLIAGGQPKSYEDLTRYLIMLPQWAVWIAAYTRRDIVRSIVECGIDSCYYDTDSQKVVNFERHEEWFNKFNEEKLKKAESMDIYGFPRDIFLKLGQFEREYEHGFTRFKVLGAKRYLIEHDGIIQCTVAGMVKGTLEEYCQYKIDEHTGEKVLRDEPLNIWDMFTDELTLSPEWSKKQTTVYYDEAFVDELTDYKGRTEVITEKSCVAIINIPFTMSMEEEFLNRIEALRQERERMIYKGVL